MDVTKVFAVIILLALSQHSLGGHFNLTKFLEKQLGKHYYTPHIHYSDQLVLPRDVAYLPEDEDNSEDNDDALVKTEEESSLQLERANRNLRPDYRNLCETRTRRVELSDTEYEYQPPHYVETYCKSYLLLDHTARNPIKPTRQLCAHPGFHCVQRSRTISLVRRRWSGDCWEPFTKEIASGCDCMWPVSTLGDISAHY